MKIILVSLAAAGVGFGAAYVYVSNEKTAEFQKEKARIESQWSDEKERLEREAKAAKSKPARVEQVTETVEVVKTLQKSPQEILDKLVQLKPAAGNGNARYSSIRDIIHQLESLNDLGPAALPAIKGFLKQNIDVSYERERVQPTEDPNQPGGQPQGGRGGPGGQNGGGRGNFGGFGGGPPPWATGGNFDLLARTEDYYPLSLRVGLFDIVKKIGGVEAEGILSESLQTTGRAVEVAHLTLLLDEMAPNKYAAMAVAAAKDLLTHPITIENPTRMDEQSKGLLYAILRKYNDVTFVSTAQSLVIDADGRVDNSALGYVTASLKEQSAPLLYSMYNDARVTNNFDKISLAASALNYVGMSTTSDQLFKDIVSNEDAGMARFMAIGRLDNGTMTPEVIQSRIALLQSIKSSTQDERMQGMMDRTIQNLNNKLNPQAATTTDANNAGRRRNRGN